VRNSCGKMTTAFSFDRPAGLATMGINVLSELSLGAGDKRMDDPIPRTASPFDLNSLLAGQSPYPTTQSPCSRLHLSQLNFSPLNFSPVAAHPNKAIAHHRHSTRDSLDHTLLLNGSPYAASTPIAINTDNVRNPSMNLPCQRIVIGGRPTCRRSRGCACGTVAVLHTGKHDGFDRPVPPTQRYTCPLSPGVCHGARAGGKESTQSARARC
jgi:hypothetical protein